jgi:hypothetical protein
MYGVILSKIKLNPSIPYSCIQLPQYYMILYYNINHEIAHFIFNYDYLQYYQPDMKQIMNRLLQNYEIMYPRWFTLYQYFKYNNDNIPFDIFVNIIQHYVDL